MIASVLYTEMLGSVPNFGNGAVVALDHDHSFRCKHYGAAYSGEIQCAVQQDLAYRAEKGREEGRGFRSAQRADP